MQVSAESATLEAGTQSGVLGGRVPQRTPCVSSRRY